ENSASAGARARASQRGRWRWRSHVKHSRASAWPAAALPRIVCPADREPLHTFRLHCDPGGCFKRAAAERCGKYPGQGQARQANGNKRDGAAALLKTA
ncbi:unnamed protein product, partial [Amoebophrya sp. A120]